MVLRLCSESNGLGNQLSTNFYNRYLDRYNLLRLRRAIVGSAAAV